MRVPAAALRWHPRIGLKGLLHQRQRAIFGRDFGTGSITDGCRVGISAIKAGAEHAGEFSRRARLFKLSRITLRRTVGRIVRSVPRLERRGRWVYSPLRAATLAGRPRTGADQNGGPPRADA
jgi:hypothetical protein